MVQGLFKPDYETNAEGWHHRAGVKEGITPGNGLITNRKNTCTDLTKSGSGLIHADLCSIAGMLYQHEHGIPFKLLVQTVRYGNKIYPSKSCCVLKSVTEAMAKYAVWYNGRR